ncbi:MAG: glutathione peroxidase [candidate division KSB1 bacterium]|nr:glutathione peroxidase [candidate division KSB1 bacterium]
MVSIDGDTVDLAQYKGKVVMIVNVASKCGNTPQYADLQKLYEKYRDAGFVVLGFPANNFLGQEPGTNQEIKEFCTVNYGVTFPMFAKISVKGKDIHPLYRYLTDKTKHPFGGDIDWNFAKFLVGRDGHLKARFSARTRPTDESVVTAIERELGQ